MLVNDNEIETQSNDKREIEDLMANIMGFFFLFYNYISRLFLWLNLNSIVIVSFYF